MSGHTAPWFLEQFRAPNGSILSGGRLYFFVAGSTVLPKKIFADYALTLELPQPLVLDASGFAPEYFMEDGLYKIVIRDSLNIVDGGMLGGLVATRDNVSGAGGGGTPAEDSYTVKVSAGDAAAGFLGEKLLDSSTITWTVMNVGGVEAMVPSVELDAVRDWKVKGDGGTGDTPGFLNAKIQDTLTIQLSVDPTTHKLQATFVGAAYVPKTGGNYTGPVTFEDGVNLVLPGTGPILGIGPGGSVTRIALPADDHLVITDLVDVIPGPLGIKLKAGAGMAFNVTVDDTNGKVIHISSVDENPITAPLDEVISGDGAGGIKSSPLFKAVGGAVAAETLRANSTAVAITAPNGSIEARSAASVDQSEWGGVGTAFFGAKGFNPPTNDGTISGLMVGQYYASLYANNGGSASIGTGVSRLAVYSSQAAIDVPLSGPAFHPTDVAVLVGATYTSGFHAVIAFFGTGTAFVVPAGNSINTTMRLTNSSAAPIAVTGTATAFTLAPGVSRDLIWTADSITPTVDKWY